MFKHRKLIKRLFLAVLFIHTLIVLSFWWTTSRFYITSGSLGLTFIALGRLFGLLGVTFALQQFILIGRLPILEKAFGQDSMSKTHQLTGYLTFFTIISHPFLIIYGNAITNRQGFIAQSLFFFKYYEDIWQASIAIICLIAIVGSSILIVRSRLKYKWWYLVHLLTYALIVFAFGHQNELGSSINGSSFSKLYWLTMYAVILGVFGFYRFLRPLWLYINHDFKVVKTEAESPNVTSIYIKGRNMEGYKWKPGQFAIFTFLQNGIMFESHPFSISNLSDDSKIIRISVKAVGDYTEKLQKVTVGTSVIIQGPYGIFGKQVESERRVVLIAGGIGITPLRCLFERYARSGREVDLIYAARSLEDLVFKNELDEITRQFENAKVYYFVESLLAAEELSNTETGNINVGRITQEKLVETVDSIQARKVFLCGPPVMMNTMERMCVRIGIPENKIYSEKFSLHR